MEIELKRIEAKIDLVISYLAPKVKIIRIDENKEKLIRKFIAENCTIDINGWISVGEFYRRSRLNRTLIYKVLNEINILNTRISVNGKQIRVYYGISWK